MGTPIAGSVRDLRRRPVEAAVVSDGLSVTASGPDGSFALPGWGPFIWICPPAGWLCRKWWVRRERARDVTFTLAPQRRSPGVRIAHLTDLHLSLRATGRAGDSGCPIDAAATEPLFAAISGARVDLALVTGDLTHCGTVAELRAARAHLAGMGVELRMLPGNHDHCGHRFEPSPRDVIAHDYELGSASFHRWEKAIGPRWWSMNLGEIHLVGLDWLSARLGVDRREQMSWLAADLGRLPESAAVVVCMHDQPDRSFTEELKRRAPHVRLLAVLSGHWHVPRAIRLDDTLHLSTGPALQSGRDGSSPQLRILSCSRTEAVSQTLTPVAQASPKLQVSPPRWVWQTRIGQGHGLQLSHHPQGVLATSADHDRAVGKVALVSGRSGRIKWSWRSPQPVSAPAAAGPSGEVYVQTSAGMAIRLDDGQPTWMVEAPDPVATRAGAVPIPTPDGGVLVEGPGIIRCLQQRDGRVRWTRTIGDLDAHYLHSSGRLAGSTAVLPSAGTSHGLIALDADRGEVAWADPPGVPHPGSSPAFFDGGTGFVTRQPNAVERFEIATGRTLWRTELPGRISAAEPVTIAELVLVVTADAAVHIVDSKTGWLLRSHVLQRSGDDGGCDPCVVGAVAGFGRFLHVVTLSGQWWRLDPFHYEPELVAILPVAVAGPPLVAAGHLILAGREGVLLAADLNGEPRPRYLAGDPASAGRRSVLARGADRWLRSNRSFGPA